MGRPPKAPDAPMTELVGFRVTAADKVLLDKLVNLRAQELLDDGADLSLGGYMRALIRREARAKGLKEDAATTVAKARLVKPEPTEEEVREKLLLVLKAGTLQQELAKEARIQASDLSRFKHGKHVLSTKSLRRLAATLAKRLP